MDLNKIQEALSSGLPEENIESRILYILSQDKRMAIYLLKMIEIERAEKEELISEFNLQLSRAQSHLAIPRISDKDFILEEIKKFYEKWKHLVKHCFNSKYP